MSDPVSSPDADRDRSGASASQHLPIPEPSLRRSDHRADLVSIQADLDASRDSESAELSPRPNRKGKKQRSKKQSKSRSSDQSDLLPAPRSRSQSAPAAGDSGDKPAFRPARNLEPAASSNSGNDPVELRAQKRKQVRSLLPRTSLALSLFLIASAATAVALFYFLDSMKSGNRGVKPRIASEGSPRNPVRRPVSTDDEKVNSIAATDAVVSKASSPVSSPSVAEPAANASLRYFRENQIAEGWRVARQAVLALQVSRRGVTRSVPATIIDSRGWAITSYAAVAGADSVVARFSPADPDETASTRDNSAPVTEFVGAWPECDLVMVLLDRRMIELVGSPPMLPRAPVAGSYLIGCGPVAGGWKAWGLESRVTVGAGLMAEAADSIVWLQHDRPVGTIAPGLPLFSVDGQLAAMSTARKEQDAIFAAPVELISAWAENMRNNPGPASASRLISALDPQRAIATLPDPATGPSAAPAATVPPVNQEAPATAEIPASTAAGPPGSGELAEFQNSLRRLTDDCAAFNFAPTSGDEHQRLLQLTRALNQARKWLEVPEDDPATLTRGQWRSLDRINQELTEKMVAALASVDRATLERANLQSLENAAPGGDAVVFVIAETNARNSPPIDGQPTAIFELEVSLGRLICQIDPERHVFRQQTRWMLFGKWKSDDRIKVRSADDSIVEARQFELLLPAGPLR